MPAIATIDVLNSMNAPRRFIASQPESGVARDAVLGLPQGLGRTLMGGELLGCAHDRPGFLETFLLLWLHSLGKLVEEFSGWLTCGIGKQGAFAEPLQSPPC